MVESNHRSRYCKRDRDDTKFKIDVKNANTSSDLNFERVSKMLRPDKLSKLFLIAQVAAINHLNRHPSKLFVFFETEKYEILNRPNKVTV